MERVALPLEPVPGGPTHQAVGLFLLSDLNALAGLWLDVPEDLEKALAETGKKAPPEEEALAAFLAKELANVAQDLEINDDLEEMGLALPEGGLFPEPLGLKPHLLSEEYAEELLSRKKGPDLASLLRGFLPDLGPELSKPTQEALAREAAGLEPGVREVVRTGVALEVLEAAKAPGTVPAGLLRWAQERLSPKVSWRGLLRQLVRREVQILRDRREPTYTLPHRRAEALDPFLLPGGLDRLPRVAVVVDTSGSMNEHRLSQAVAEVGAILKLGARVTVYAVDAAVHEAKRVFREDQVRRLAGGGGTDMGAGLERAVADGHRLVVVLTDGYTPWPSHPPKARVVVCLLGDGPEPPGWAKAVRVET